MKRHRWTEIGRDPQRHLQTNTDAHADTRTDIPTDTHTETHTTQADITLAHTHRQTDTYTQTHTHKRFYKNIRFDTQSLTDKQDSTQKPCAHKSSNHRARQTAVEILLQLLTNRRCTHRHRQSYTHTHAQTRSHNNIVTHRRLLHTNAFTQTSALTHQA